MSQLKQDILALLKSSQGMEVSEIARKLQVDQDDVKMILLKDLKETCYQDTSYRWHYQAQNISQISDSAKTNSLLSNLCTYYLNCLSIQDNNSISESLTSNDSLKYAELKNLDINSKENLPAIEFLIKAISPPNRNTVAYIGYPTLIQASSSLRTERKRLTVSPVFLFPVEYNSGKITTSSVPGINKEVIKQFSAQNSNDSLIYEIIELEKQLGLDKSGNHIELDELVNRLQRQRQQWNWKEDINPETITSTPSIQTITSPGIYNRAIVIITEKSPFTLGLENELLTLSKLEPDAYKGTALYDWLHSDKTVEKIDETLSDNILEVLPLNAEQEQAVRIALKSDITIVTGPPGTGKSQVVTNLLINAIWKAQKVLFTSRNNKAVDVVDTRLNNLGTHPVMLRIGATQDHSNILSVINTLLSSGIDLQNQIDYKNLSQTYLDEVAIYNSLRNRKEAFITLRNRIDQLEQKVCSFREDWHRHYPDITSQQIDELRNTYLVCDKIFNKTIKEKQKGISRILWHILIKSRLKKLHKNITCFNKLSIRYGLKALSADFNETTWKEYAFDLKGQINNMYSILEYKDLLKNLSHTESLEKIDHKLWQHKVSLAQKAATLWNKWLLARPIHISPVERKNMARFVSALKLQEGNHTGRNPKFAKELTDMHKLAAKFLPCWAITALSAKGRIPFSPAIYDLLIIDEASQCDIASILPLLYRAKRVVIIGDNKQLPHISAISRKQDINLLQKYGIGYEWSYSSNSIFDLANAVSSSSSLVNLLDHHRSFADIIEFSNNEFYDGKLRVATDYRSLKLPKNENAGVRWLDTKGKVVRPDNGSAYNDFEIKRTIEELTRLVINNDYQGTIGVVTPFRAQADKIRYEVEKIPELKNRLYAKNNFLVDTVHKFQGDEKDIIIFSSVISQNTHQAAIAFLRETGNLFNVAITRARSILMVIGDMDYCSACNVSYMEHFVEYTRTLGNKVSLSDNSPFYPEAREYPNVSNIEQVSEWEKYLYTKLFDAGIITTPQYPVDKYRLDLAIIVNDKKKLDIEIDGEMYHRDWTGELCYRDQLRNQRLFELGWEVKRFWVYQIRDQLPWCIEQVRQWLHDASLN